MLNPDFRAGLVKTFKNNKGNIPLTMYLFDPATKYRIEFLSNKFSVAVSTDLLNALKEMNISYQAIRK